ncbi:MAG: Mov34/MPN/PAD-1 family protein [Candidatus Helarchaeota archaeon]
MIIEIESQALDLVKEEVSAIQNKKTFKEIGGYLLGTFDGRKIIIKKFHLDKYSESSPTRIKLSTEAFDEIEQIRKEESNSNLIHAGTWHVHPSNEEPYYSQTDLSTLFLEKFRITTDNPVNVDAPLVHIIFNKELSTFNCFTLNFNAQYNLVKLHEMPDNSYINDEYLEDARELFEDLSEILKNSLNPKNIDLAIMDCEEIEDNIGDLRMQLKAIKEIQSYFVFYDKHEKIFREKIIHFMKETEKIGIIHVDENMDIYLEKYRPKKIKEKYNDETLIGFFIQIPFPNITEYLERIYLFNFLHKLGNPDFDPFLLILIHEEDGKFVFIPKSFYLESYDDIFYEKMETLIV